MAKKILMLSLMVASFAAVAPAAVVVRGGYGYGGHGVRVGVYAAPRYAYAPRYYAAPVVPYVAPYVAPAYPVYAAPYGYGYGYRGYVGGYYGGGYYRGGGSYRGGYARGYRR